MLIKSNLPATMKTALEAALTAAAESALHTWQRIVNHATVLPLSCDAVFSHQWREGQGL